MEESDFIFKGKRFKYLKDFEQEFKPTKWSIRKLMNFTKDFLPFDRFKFENHVIAMLNDYGGTDKDTLNFIQQINYKRYNRANILEREHLGIGPLLPKSKETYDKVIKMFVVLQKTGMIEGNLREVADFLKLKFGINLSISTIRGKMYSFSEQLNEKKFREETFNNFHEFIRNI